MRVGVREMAVAALMLMVFRSDKINSRRGIYDIDSGCSSLYDPVCPELQT
jgi:hypothetical protein